MAIKKVCEKIILIILTISILLSFMATPIANAGLELKEGEFYYSGTTKGTYTMPTNIFAWLIDNLAKIADWILGLITMGVRMVFVGWTALIEKLLTWAVESSAGVTASGAPMVDSTDMTALGDSSGNVTVQAIVYNQVPLFDINFFNLEIDKTVNGTGQKLICSSCRLPCEECCEINGSEPGNYTSETKSDVKCNCTGTNMCDACQRYLNNWNAKKPLVIQIREFVAMWYTIIRLLSMVAMLIALLGIGIKMALSTIASEKAVYKRMLIDWVVGMIILFLIHYLIYFVIILNETLVDTVKETANSINKTQIQFVNSGNKSKDDETIQEVEDQEIELNIYEEIRTRAYDPKLSVGLSGMIMYMTLLYFAVRYSISYVKRYLTVIVLALMAPPLGVSYALQKALTGKSASLKTWMTEFIMTVIIQIVHALIYAVFISTALALSMASIPGMIVALIFMNFALKAEKIFREIFKMGDSNSLAGSAAEAGSAEKIQSNVRNAIATAKSVKPIAGALWNSPMAKGIKAVGKAEMAVSGSVKTAIMGAIEKRKNENNPTNDGLSVGENDTGSDNALPEGIGGEAALPTGGSSSGTVENSRPSMVSEEKDKAILSAGGEKLREQAAIGIQALKNPNITPEEKEKAEEAVGNYIRYQQLMQTGTTRKDKQLDASENGLEVRVGLAKKAINITNRYEAAVANKPEIKADANFKTFRKAWRKAGQGYRTAMGSKYYDVKKGKMVYGTKGYYSQFNPSNYFGLSEKDKKFIKTEAMKPLKGVLGAASMFLGLSTMVAHPAVGGALLVGGRSKYRAAFKQPVGNRAYKARYGNARFNAATAQTVQQELLKQAYEAINEDEKLYNSEMIARVREDHPELYKAIMEDLKEGGDYSGLRISGSPAFEGARNLGKTGVKAVKAATYVPKKWARVSGIFNTAAYGDSMAAIDKFALAREKEELAAFEKEASNSLKIAYQQEMDKLINAEDKKIEEDRELQEQAFLEKIIQDSGNSQLQEYIKKCEESGFTYDSGTHKLKGPELDEIDETQFNDTHSKVKTAEGRRIVEETIETVIKDMYRVSGKIENTEADTNQTLQLVQSRLKSEGILSTDDTVEVLFKDGDSAKTVVKTKIENFNKQTAGIENIGKVEEAISESQGFSEEERNELQQMILKGETKGLSTEEVLNRISQPILANQSQGQPVGPRNTTGGPSTSINGQGTAKEKKKLKALDKFLKMDVTEEAKKQVSTEAVRTIMTEEDRNAAKVEAKKKSRKKFQKVLQFMAESGEDSIAGLIDKTEQKVNNAREGIKVGKETLEFNDTEADALKKLFDKMREEVVFNEFTKDVLDQKDSDATKKAKAAYIDSKRDLSNETIRIISDDKKVKKIIDENQNFGIDATNVVKVISGTITATEITDSLNETKLNEIYDREFAGEIRPMKEKKSKVSSVIDKRLEQLGQTDLKTITAKRQQAEKAQKKSLMTGKIDIYSQIKKLDEIN